MDSATLSSLTDLLSGASAPKLRAAATAAIAASTSGDENGQTRAAIGQSPTLLRRLLALRGDASAGRLALSALVNLAEDEGAAKELISMRAVATSAASLLDADQRPLSSLHAALLSNLTRFSAGVDSLVGTDEKMNSSEKKIAVATLVKLFENLEKLPNFLFLANACTNDRGRKILLDAGSDSSTEHSLNALFLYLNDEDNDKRLAAASAFRNCAVSEHCHITLLQCTDVLGIALTRLMSSSRPVHLDDVLKAPKEVLNAATSHDVASEPLSEIRLLIVEALLLLCQGKTGRDILRDREAYPVLREWHMLENDETVKATVEQIVQRTYLLKEEKCETDQENAKGSKVTDSERHEDGVSS